MLYSLEDITLRVCRFGSLSYISVSSPYDHVCLETKPSNPVIHVLPLARGIEKNVEAHLAVKVISNFSPPPLSRCHVRQKSSSSWGKDGGGGGTGGGIIIKWREAEESSADGWDGDLIIPSLG